MKKQIQSGSICVEDGCVCSKTNKVLIVELSDCHGECLPGYIKYFQDLGYQVDVLVNKAQLVEKPLFMFDDIKVTYDNSENIFKYLGTLSNKEYDFCLFNSNILYMHKSLSIFHFLKLQNSSPKILCVEHSLEYLPLLLPKAIPLVLKNFNNSDMVFEVNPHYFGKYPHHHKNEISNFIVVGWIDSKRKNYNLLISAVRQLVNKKIYNFRITIVGKGDISNIPEDIRSYFKITGR